MWWDEGSWVSNRIDAISAARREQALPAVTAVGSTWTEEGERTLFVGVHPRRDPRPWAWAPGADARARLARGLIQRFGPLPYPSEMSSGREAVYVPEEVDSDLDVRTRVSVEASLSRVVRTLVALRREEAEVRSALLVLRLPQADVRTREELAPFELPGTTRIGYVGPIQPRGKKGRAVFRRWPTSRGTIGSVIDAERGPFLTTAGHLGAGVGEVVYRRKPGVLWGDKPLGRIAAVTCPEAPDSLPTAAGVDIAAISPEPGSDLGAWSRVEPGDPRGLRRGAYVRWNGGVTGPHTGAVTILAQDAAGMGGVDYEHVVMVLGDPPGYAGAGGDSGTGMYDADGRLLGYFVGTEGGRSSRGVAAAGWFQTIDTVQPYLEDRCGPVARYLGS